MRRLSSILILVAALAFSACGGSDKKNNASTTTGTTQSTAGTTGSTGATGATGRGRKSKKKSTGKNSSGSKGKGGSPGGSKSGGSTTPSRTTTQTQTTPPSQGTTPTPSNISPAKTAKTVCSQFLPEAIKRDIKRGKLTKKKVATQYSKGYPKDQRSQAYKGCLAGLNKIA